MFHHFTWMSIDICLSGKNSLSIDFCRSQMNERCTIHVSDAAGEFSLKKTKLIHSTALLLHSAYPWKKVYRRVAAVAFIFHLFLARLACATSSLDAISRGRINKYMPHTGIHSFVVTVLQIAANANTREREINRDGYRAHTNKVKKELTV